MQKCQNAKVSKCQNAKIIFFDCDPSLRHEALAFKLISPCFVWQHITIYGHDFRKHSLDKRAELIPPEKEHKAAAHSAGARRHCKHAADRARHNAIPAMALCSLRVGDTQR